MVIIWVDDGHICSSSSEAIDEIISYLSEHFEMHSSEANNFVWSVHFTQEAKKSRMQSRLHFEKQLAP
jgi:hypothetical protein